MLLPNMNILHLHLSEITHHSFIIYILTHSSKYIPITKQKYIPITKHSITIHNTKKKKKKKKTTDSMFLTKVYVIVLDLL